MIWCIKTYIIAYVKTAKKNIMLMLLVPWKQSHSIIAALIDGLLYFHSTLSLGAHFDMNMPYYQ